MPRSRIFIVLTAALVVTTLSCRKALQPTPEVVVIERPTLALAPDDDAWKKAPPHIAALLLQDMVDPRLMKSSTAQVEVRAMTDGRDVAFRLSWDDATKSDLPGPSRFTDACAIQLPTKGEPDLPAPQMGEPGRPVEIAVWRASWQAVVDGRGDTIRDIYPGATVDHYPFEAAPLKPGSPEQEAMAARYAPARGLGNPMAGPRNKPVQTLLAEGPGTLTPNPAATAEASGAWKDGKWTVVISRPLPPGLGTDSRSQIAFAVWEGSHEEVGARKMRTGWVPMMRQGKR